MTGEPQARSFGRSAGTLSAGVGAAGLLTYVFFALAAHNLDATAYGEIVVLWSATFVTISVLHRPVEQFISRSIAERRTLEQPIGPPLRTAARIQAVVAAAFAVAALVLRDPLQDDLFSGSATLYWVYVSAVLAFAASFFARGYLAGEGRFGLLAALLVSESFSRMAFSLAVAVGIAAAPLLSLAVGPLAFVHRAARAAQPPAATAPASAPAASLAKGGAFAAAVLLIMLSEQIFLNAGPLLVRAEDGAAEAGYIFNVLMLARAPLLVFQGIAISLLPHLTRLRSRGGTEAAAAFDVSVDTTLRAVAAFTALVAVVVAIAGPELMQAAFSDRFEYDRAGLLIVTGAMGLYLAATTLNQAALAQGQARSACAAWGSCALGFLVWSLLPIVDAPDRRIEVGFLAAAAVLFCLLRVIYRDPRRRDAPGLSAAEEIEAGLALADEAS
jgi:O-antigen/teichoic acid export membrane protein